MQWALTPSYGILNPTINADNKNSASVLLWEPINSNQKGACTRRTTSLLSGWFYISTTRPVPHPVTRTDQVVTFTEVTGILEMTVLPAKSAPGIVLPTDKQELNTPFGYCVPTHTPLFPINKMPFIPIVACERHSRAQTLGPKLGMFSIPLQRRVLRCLSPKLLIIPQPSCSRIFMISPMNNT